jgi:protein CpxP
MKTRTILAIAVLFVLAMAANSYAQMGGNPQDRLKKSLEDYKTRLKLTDDQFRSFEKILTDQMAEVTKIRESAGEDREAMRASIMDLRDKTNKKLEALLKDDQKAEWKKMQEEAAARRQGGGGGRG